MMSLKAVKETEFGKCPHLLVGGMPDWWDLTSHLKAWSLPMCTCKFTHGWRSSYGQSGFSLSLLHISRKGALGAEGKQESDPTL